MYKSKKSKRGIHSSPKSGGECCYRSSWELKYMQHLDRDDEVIAYRYEPFKISYVSNKKTGKIRNYIPDIIVLRGEAELELVEIKPSKRLAQRRVAQKLRAAVEWCDDAGVLFSVITERELKALKLL